MQHRASKSIPECEIGDGTRAPGVGSRGLARVKNVALSIGGLVIALGLAEVALRLFSLYSPPDWPPRQLRAGFYRADPLTGYRLYPSTRTCLRYPDQGGPVFELVSNSDGFRSSRELGEPDPRPRIALLGDSFVFGLGVKEGERFSEVVEDLDPRWRSDNLGMPGFGADLMVRTLEALGKKAKPNVVVLAMYTHDFVRVNPQYAGMGFPSPKYVLDGGALREIPFPESAGFRRLRLWQVVQDLKTRRDPSQLALNEALFERFRTLSIQLGAKPVALFLPGRGDVEVDRIRRDALRAWAARRHVPFRDLSTPIFAAGVELTYIPNNPHWNARGHRIAGEVLHALLASEVLPDAGTAPGSSSLAPLPWRRRGPSFCYDALVEGRKSEARP